MLKHNKRKLMLFKTGIARSEDRNVDEHTILSSGHSVTCKERFIHLDVKDLNHWINKMNWYAEKEMRDYYAYKSDAGNSDMSEASDKGILSQRKKKFGLYYRFPMFFRCWLLFVYYYIFRLGFLDGKEGFVYHWMYHRWYRTLVDAKILEQKISKRPFTDLGDLK